MSTQFYTVKGRNEPDELVAVRFCAAEGLALRFYKKVSFSQVLVDEAGALCTLAGVVHDSIVGGDRDSLESARATWGF